MTTSKKDTRLNIRVTDEELEHLKALAAETKMTLADWVRQKLLGHGDELAELKIQVSQLNQRLADIENRLSAV